RGGAEAARRQPVRAEPLISDRDFPGWRRALSRWRELAVKLVMRATIRFFTAFAMLHGIGVGSAAAQPADQIAAHRRYKEAVGAGNYQSALGEALQLERLASPFGNAPPAYYADVLVHLGEARLAVGDYLEAEVNFKDALTIRDRTPGQAPADIAW